MSVQHLRDTPRKLYQKLLIALVFVIMLLIFVLPLATIVTQLLNAGIQKIYDTFVDSEILKAIRLSLVICFVTLPINIVIGFALAWCLGRFKFALNKTMAVIIDLPFTLSPIMVGLLYLMLYNRNGIIGTWFLAHGIKIMFTPLALVLVSIFVSFPFVAREILLALQHCTSVEAEAALSLGAKPTQLFWRIIIPSLRTSILYGLVLSFTRVLGEYGSSSVVSGNVRGETITLPLLVNQLFNDGNIDGAFIIAGFMMLIAFILVGIRLAIEARK